MRYPGCYSCLVIESSAVPFYEIVVIIINILYS
jgi:hypothetical protein